MAGPFYNGIKGTTNTPPLMLAFTPNAAAIGFLAWSTVPAGWFGMVRFEDGAEWELSYCYWNGSTLSRSAAQEVSSSTGSLLTLTAAATATMICNGARVAPHPMVPQRGAWPIVNATTAPTVIGMAAGTATGTAAAGTIGSTNYLTGQPRVHYASATTANAQSGYSHSAQMMLTGFGTGLGGYEFSCRFGATALPTGPRLFVGTSNSTFVGNTGEPSAFVSSYAAFAKDSTDTNIQLLVNSNSGGGTKIDTGIPLAANGWYEATIWCDPGSATIFALLVRIDTGAIWYGTTSTDVPPAGAVMMPHCLGGLSATTGTAFTMAFGGYTIRNGAW